MLAVRAPGAQSEEAISVAGACFRYFDRAEGWREHMRSAEFTRCKSKGSERYRHAASAIFKWIYELVITDQK